MHFLYVVATKKDEDIMSKEQVSNEVRNQLEQEGFCCESGFWASGRGDWFVVGGRWSGWLREIQLDDWNTKAKDLIEKNRTEEERNGNLHFFVSTTDIEKNKEALQALWESLGGTGKNVWDRNNYQSEGYEEDTMLLDEKLLEALKKQKIEETEVAIYDEGYIQDEEKLSDFLTREDIIGNYYLTVIDYHS